MKRIGPFGLAIGAIASQAGAKAPPPVPISIACSADGQLTQVRVAGREIVVPGESQDAALRAALPDREASIVIVNRTAMSYRCIGELIYKLQSMRYRRIAFISEPPPPSE